MIINGTTHADAQKPMFLVAPGVIRLMPTVPVASYGISASGTSFAAPAVAGAAALFRDQFTPTNGRVMHAVLLAMGEGWSGTGTSVTVVGTTASAGAGRLRTLRPNFWGYRSFSLTKYQQVCWAIGNGALTGYSGWKAGMTWDEPDLNNAADLDLYVKDATTGSLLYYQADNAIHNRVRLNAAQISGKTLQECIYAYHVPAGQSRTVYAADFVHSYPGD